MADETMSAGITVEWQETTDEAFVPEASSEIFAKLTPLQADDATFYSSDYLDFYKTVLPPFISTYPELPAYEEPQGELILNIETTGVKPWESRLIAIGVLDPNVLEPAAINFIEETEEETLDKFLEWFEAQDYKKLIGYNVSFDYRFLYVLMQKYRKYGGVWKEIKLYDLMQQQKQVKDSFVYGFNPTGKLEDWATYLLGTQPYAPQKMVYKWLKEGNIDEIVNFNSDKLVKAYYLWVLDKVVAGTIPGTEVLGRPATPTEEKTEPQGSSNPTPEVPTISVQCPNCLQVQDMSKTDKVKLCEVCGTSISNPAL